MKRKIKTDGSTRYTTGMTTSREAMNDEFLNDDAVTHLRCSLQAKLSALEEENRLTARTEMIAFERQPN